MRSGFRQVYPYFLAALACWLTVRWLLPIGMPFLLGMGMALAAEPGVRFLCSRLRLPRTAAAGIGVSGVFLAICALAAVLLTLCFRELGILAGILPDMEGMVRDGMGALQTWLLGMTGRIPRSFQPLLQRNVTEFFSGSTALLDRFVRYALGLAGNILAHLPDSALGLATAVLSAFLISAKLPQLRESIRRRIPEQRLQAMKNAIHRIRQTVGLWLVAQVKLTGVTYGILTAGFLLLRISYAPVWAMAAAAVDAFPILGTGTVLVPWSVVCMLRGDGTRAIGLLGVYAVAALTRSMLEPRFVGKQLGLDPLVTLIAMYAGFRLWGFAGLLLTPVLAITVLRVIQETS